MPTFTGYVNPLVFFGVDDHLRDKAAVPTVEDILSAAVIPGTDPRPEAFQARCLELAAFGNIPIAASDGFTFDKLIWPLRAAKANYGFGNFAAVIGLCGMVCEMVTTTYFDGGVPYKGKAFTGEDIDKEKVSQDAKIKELLAQGILTQADADALHDVRLTRNKFLHWASHPHTDIQEHAKRLYGATIKQVINLTIKGFKEGKLVFGKHYEDGLTRRGVLKAGE